MSEKEKTLSEALSYAAVPELPAELLAGDNSWVKAIVLVRKFNNNENYALAINNGESVTIVKDFGTLSAIREILNIYPYARLGVKSTPNLHNREEIVLYLVNHGEDEAYIRQLMSKECKSGKPKAEATYNKDKATIKALVNKCALKEEQDRKLATEAAMEVVQYYNNLPELPLDEE